MSSACLGPCAIEDMGLVPAERKSGTGLPHSTTLREAGGRATFRQVFCAAPAALFGRSANRLILPSLNSPLQSSKSGPELPHSKTWRDHHAPPKLHQVLECAAPAA